MQLSKQYYLDKGKWIAKSELQKATKGRFHLHSQSIQAVCHKYLYARDAAHQAIRKGIQTARYPYKSKNHHTLAAFAESGEALIITGRKIRSIHRLRNKKLAAIQRLQSHRVDVLFHLQSKPIRTIRYHNKARFP